MPEDDDVTVEDLLTLLWEVTRAMRLQDRTRRGDGLGPSHVFLLFHLRGDVPHRKDSGRDEGEGPTRLSDLARALKLTPAAVTQIVSDLEARGLVMRTKDPRDRRVVGVALTPKGEEQLQAFSRRRRIRAASFLAPLDARDRRDLARVLRRLLRDDPGSSQHDSQEAR